MLMIQEPYFENHSHSRDVEQMAWLWSQTTFLSNLPSLSLFICKMRITTYALYPSMAVTWGPNTMMYVTENVYTGKNHTNERKWEAQEQEQHFFVIWKISFTSWICIFTSRIITCKFLNLSVAFFPPHLQMVQKIVVRIHRCCFPSEHSPVQGWATGQPGPQFSCCGSLLYITVLPRLAILMCMKHVLYQPASPNPVCPEEMTFLYLPLLTNPPLGHPTYRRTMIAAGSFSTCAICCSK